MSAQLHGLIAEFNSPQELVEASRAAYSEGYRKMDAYSPYPIEEVCEALGFHGNRMPLIVLLGGIAGGLFGYGMQYWMTVISYPLNVGGKPFHSMPLYIPVTFECIILFGALSAVIGMFLLNGLPMPYHPVFNAPNFHRASSDGFFLCIEATDPKFDIEKTRGFLARLQPQQVSEVED
jgi:hypothetical protein